MSAPRPDGGLTPGSGPRGDRRLAVLDGVVGHGDARGRTLGFPTANLAWTFAEPANGVYAGTAEVGGRELVAAVSVGRRGTFYGTAGARLVEVHLLDFDGDLYGEPIRVTLYRWLRGQRTFDEPAALMAQLHRDVARTRTWAAGKPVARTAPEVPRWALRRATGVLQGRSPASLPDAAALARAAGISPGLARRCLAAYTGAPGGPLRQ